MVYVCMQSEEFDYVFVYVMCAHDICCAILSACCTMWTSAMPYPYVI